MGLFAAYLGPLTREQARDLLGDTVDDAVIRGLFDESGGNPFYLNSWRDRSVELLQDSLWPTRLWPVLMCRMPLPVRSPRSLSLLSDDAVVLQGAAVAGDRSNPSLPPLPPPPKRWRWRRWMPYSGLT